MSKNSTFNYLVNSYKAGKREVLMLQNMEVFSEISAESGDCFEPSKSCIDAILSFASQYEVLKSCQSDSIELNLN
jgi:hypothetical protein